MSLVVTGGGVGPIEGKRWDGKGEGREEERAGKEEGGREEKARGS